MRNPQHWRCGVDMAIPTRKVGPYEVSAIGLGCWPLSGVPKAASHILQDRDGAIAVIQAALDLGITLIDTADVYAPTWNTFGHNELLLAEAIRTWSGNSQAKAKIVVATKGGVTRDKGVDAFGIGGRNASKHYLYRAVEASALRLGVSKIKLWQHHRLDPAIPYETQFENVMTLHQHGFVQNIGIGNVNAEQLRRAIKIGGKASEGGVVSVQNEFSPRQRNWQEVIDICAENGIAYLPWSPLGGIDKGAADVGTSRYGKFVEVANTKGVSPFAITIAWHLANFPNSIPIPGSTKVANYLDTAQGLNVQLSADELELLNSNLPPSSPVEEELLDGVQFRD